VVLLEEVVVLGFSAFAISVVKQISDEPQGKDGGDHKV
jgi:hypothetical protein